MEPAKYLIECSEDMAPRFADWIANRGGVAQWSSINLSNPGASWSAPVRDSLGNILGKPTWEASNVPLIVTDPAQVGVYTEVLFKEVTVSLRMGSGMSLKLSDASQRKLDKAMDQCKEAHGNAHYRKGSLDFPCMFVYYTTGMESLAAWKERQA